MNRRTTRRQTNFLSIPSYLNDQTEGGQVLAVGDNGMTQLGLKSTIDQRKNPQPVPIPEPIVQIAAGPLHSACLTDENHIFTFGCNDEHALGRPDTDDNNNEEEDPFGEVDMSKVMTDDDEKIIQLVAGDSHTFALSNLGKVYDCYTLGHVSFEYKWSLWSCTSWKNGQKTSGNSCSRENHKNCQWL